MGSTKGKIHLMLPGNAFHSELNRWAEVDKSKAGLEVIGSSGVPVSVSFQGIDFELWPWLREVIDRYPTLDLIDAPYSHALLPLLHSKQQEWQISQSDIIHPAIFYPEFYSPAVEFIRKAAFFVLASQTVAYSQEADLDFIISNQHDGVNLEGTDAIFYSDKLGLVMRNFESLLQAFFSFQRDPMGEQGGVLAMDKLLQIFEKILSETDKTIILPIDVEAPFIGSIGGARIWQMFFDGLRRSGLAEYFVPLSVVMEELRSKAVRSPRPHRIVGTKWTKYEVQVKYLAKVAGYVPRSTREQQLAAIATSSDVLSALMKKIDNTKGYKVMPAKDFDGRDVPITIRPSQDVLDICYAAMRALTDKKSFVGLLAGTCNTSSLFVSRMRQWAERNDL